MKRYYPDILPTKQDDRASRISDEQKQPLCRTFEEAELLEEAGDDEGVAEIEQEATEHQAMVVLVGGVWTRVDVTH